MKLIGINATHSIDAGIVGRMLEDVLQTQRYDQAIRNIAKTSLGLTDKQMDDHRVMNAYLPSHWSYIREERFVEGGKVELKPVQYHLTPAKVMQKIQALGREIHSQFWVNTLFTKFDAEYSNWCVNDVTFPNEANAIVERGGTIFKLVRLEKSEQKDYLQRYPHIQKTFVIDTGNSLDVAVKFIREYAFPHRKG